MISMICIREHLQAISVKSLAQQIAGDGYFTTQYIDDENIRGSKKYSVTLTDCIHQG